MVHILWYERIQRMTITPIWKYNSFELLMSKLMTSQQAHASSYHDEGKYGASTRGSTCLFMAIKERDMTLLIYMRIWDGVYSILSQTTVPRTLSLHIILDLIANWCMITVCHYFHSRIHLMAHNNSIVMNNSSGALHHTQLYLPRSYFLEEPLTTQVIRNNKMITATTLIQ